MESLPSHSELRRELKRRGLPPAYIARLLAELDDHFTDLIEERNSTMGAARKLQIESQEAERRIGKPTKLAIFSAEQYHARSFLGRHPLLTFLLGPLSLLIVGWATIGVLFFAMDYAIQACDYLWTAISGWSFAAIPEENHPFVQAVFLALMSWAVVVFPPLLAAAVLCRVAARNGLSWRWPTLGCGLLAIVAAVSMVNYRIKTIDAMGQWMVGLNLALTMQWWLTTFLPRFALAMGIGLLLVKRSQQRFELASQSASIAS